jgi:hypothetical protein
MLHNSLTQVLRKEICYITVSQVYTEYILLINWDVDLPIYHQINETITLN